ncbi:Ada metal-binding domain-containing protein [Leptospira venezuelensis]|uniref:Ada metal-binding domain-containing protein n=1 Tax=Leptospira venezuelensis TaxID=1958811 RepID=UPI000A388F06|nr:Ada metal-binding domain-containing protein [Leptospira venezuelensis]
MFLHLELQPQELRSLIRKRKLDFAGNLKLKIYGTLSCESGKRMKKENRIFFSSEKEAISLGFRPCGHCLKEKYKVWKHGTV